MGLATGPSQGHMHVVFGTTGFLAYFNTPFVFFAKIGLWNRYFQWPYMYSES